MTGARHVVPSDSEQTQRAQWPPLVITDFDRTLVRLLSDGDRHELWTRLVAVYEAHGLSTSLIKSLDDAYALWARAYSALPNAKRNLAHEEATALLTSFEMRGAERASLLPKIRDALVSCVQSGSQLAIVSSNDPHAIRLALDRADVLGLFRVILARTDASHISDMKPSPRLLLEVLAILERPSQDAIYVGDSQDDMRAAKRAAIRGVGVLTGTADRQQLEVAGASIVVTDFGSLPAALQ